MESVGGVQESWFCWKVKYIGLLSSSGVMSVTRPSSQ